MANKVYKGEIYNEDIKQRFLDEYSGKTQESMRRMFRISYALEVEYGKDLYDFNREQLRRLLYLFMPTTPHASRTNVSAVEKYIDWAIDEGLVSGINPLTGISNEWKEQFVNGSIKIYWTKDEIDHIIKTRRNAQDAVIVSLLFNGVRGTANCELLQLRKSDIDQKKKTLKLTEEDGSHRIIVVDDQCIDLCLKALRETEYEKKNGKTSPDIRNPVSNLVENEYVIRSSHTQTEHFDMAEKNIVHRRLSNIAEEMEEPYFNPLNIFKSGMLYMAYEIYKNKQKLGKEEYRAICERFNINKTSTGEKSEYNYSRLKSDFLNLETLKKLYKDLD